jgi:prepilin-type N-terminal cleavage/methylation domain-containing protein
MQPHLSNQRGMTLPEVLVVVALIAVVGLALLGAIQYFYRANAYVLEQAAATDNARRAIATTMQNLREATYGDDGSYPLGSAATSTVTFYADVDNDQSVERIRIYLSDSTLYRGITNSAGNPATYSGQTETTATIITNVRNTASEPVFTYFDADGAQLSATSTDSADVRTVKANVRIDLNPLRAPNLFSLSGTASLRNIYTD